MENLGKNDAVDWELNKNFHNFEICKEKLSRKYTSVICFLIFSSQSQYTNTLKLWDIIWNRIGKVTSAKNWEMQSKKYFRRELETNAGNTIEIKTGQACVGRLKIWGFSSDNLV